MTRGRTASNTALVGWVYLDVGYTVRWRRGDPAAHVLTGEQLDNHGAVGVVDTIPVAPSGWADLAEIRQLGQRWWQRQRAQRTHDRAAC